MKVRIAFLIILFIFHSLSDFAVKKRVLKNKEKFSGCTVHFVNSRLDSGKIILKKKVKISKKETEVSLSKKILVQEHKLYPKAIRKVFSL